MPIELIIAAPPNKGVRGIGGPQPQAPPRPVIAVFLGLYMSEQSRRVVYRIGGRQCAAQYFSSSFA